VSFVDVRALEASGAASADLGGSVLGAGSDGRTARVGGGAAGSVDATGASTASRSGDVEAGVATDLARSASSAPDRLHARPWPQWLGPPVPRPRR